MLEAVSDWVGHAQRELEREGYRLSAPRSAVVATLADLGCSVTAKEIADRLNERGEERRSAWRASTGRSSCSTSCGSRAASTPPRAWRATSPWARAGSTTTISS